MYFTVCTLGYISRSGIDVLQGLCIFNDNRSCQMFYKVALSIPLDQNTYKASPESRNGEIYSTP